MGLMASWYARMIHIKSWRIDLPPLRDLLPMFLKAGSQLRRRSNARRVASRHSDVDRRQIVLVQTKGFSRQALDTVAGHCGAESTSRYRQTQSRMTSMIREHRHTEVRVGQPAAAHTDRAKFGRLMQTLARLERQPLVQMGSLEALTRPLGAEALAALRAAASQQSAAAFGGHARSETMGSGTVQIAGVKSTFHSATSGNLRGKSSNRKICERRQGYLASVDVSIDAPSTWS